jgi:hypothetical protein
MPPRLDLQTLLKSLIGLGEVYFQPPAGLRMTYPCIVYQRNNANTQFANNNPYIYEKQYQITVIDKDPDSLIPDKISKLPTCVFNRHFTADGFNHDVFTMYF